MKLKSLLIFILAVTLGMTLNARRSVSYLHDGNAVTATIIDISSRNGNIDYDTGLKVHRSRIWMINFEDGNWNFPHERRQLSNNTDTIFLNNGHVLHVQIVDFSSRRQVFEFRNGGSVHEGQIKRIYFCCTKLPAFYEQQITSPRRHHSDDINDSPAVFLRNGTYIQKPLSYLNHTKTGFVGGSQIDTNEIWMINFEDQNWNFGREREQLNRNQDTIFMKDGEILYDTVLDYSKTRQSFRFKNTQPIPARNIMRIYFCCEALPYAYHGKLGRSDQFKRHNIRRR